MLHHTPAVVAERKALRINPAKTCQPVGAMYAALGIHRCLPHSHGSQGCCAYHRSHLTRHYREPVMASTSSFTEGASVFGGAPNLRQALATIFDVYDPDVVAIHTTCLSETIGDDIPSILKKAAADGIIPHSKRVFHANTPSYVGSHVTGFANMVRAMVETFPVPAAERMEAVNMIPGYVEPSDMREVKHLAKMLGVDARVFPDTSGVLDAPQTASFRMYPSGGTPVSVLERLGESRLTVALGPAASEPAARFLEAAHGVPCRVLDLPIGLRATDRFVQTLLEDAGGALSPELNDERGRLVDLMTDMHAHLHGKRVALWGDPDPVVSLTEFLADLGMQPVCVLTGTPGKRFELRVRGILKKTAPRAVVRAAADLFFLHQVVKKEPVDLLIGNTYGKYIARAEDVPHVRFGWPILDRVGHAHFPTLGYRGGLYLLTRIVNTLLERADRDAPDEELELVL